MSGQIIVSVISISVEKKSYWWNDVLHYASLSIFLYILLTFYSYFVLSHNLSITYANLSEKIEKLDFLKPGCGNPPLIKNGFAVRLPPYNEGDAVTYDCFPGYELIAADGFYLLCRQDLWINMSESRTFPFCRRGK